MELKWFLEDYNSVQLDESFFGAIVQYPNSEGSIEDYRNFIENAHAINAQVIMATDLMALTLLTPPGELGADVAVGSSQRFGVPMGFGGPHAAFFATKDEFKRNIPGRIIGVSVDAQDNRACVWLCKQENNTYAVKKQLQTFVLHRLCWQIWLQCMQCIMALKD